MFVPKNVVALTSVALMIKDAELALCRTWSRAGIQLGNGSLDGKPSTRFFRSQNIKCDRAKPSLVNSSVF